MIDILKSIEKHEPVTLSKEDSVHLDEYIEGLKKQAADGALYRGSLVKDVLRFSAVIEPDISRKTMESITKSLSVEELREVRDAYKAKASKKLPPVVQLVPQKSEKKNNENTDFKI